MDMNSELYLPMATSNRKIKAQKLFRGQMGGGEGKAFKLERRWLWNELVFLPRPRLDERREQPIQQVGNPMEPG